MFVMVSRCFEILDHLDREDETLADLLPSALANKRLRTLLENLKTVETVSNQLQSATVTVWEVRPLIEDFPPIAEYLGLSSVSLLKEFV